MISKERGIVRRFLWVNISVREIEERFQFFGPRKEKILCVRMDLPTCGW
jgi:hypothetical protein